MKNGMKSRIAAFLLVLLMALQALPLGILSFASEAEMGAGDVADEPVVYTDADYNALYVDGGDLVYAWDAFGITADFDGQAVSWVDGTTVISLSNYVWNYVEKLDNDANLKETGLASKGFIANGAVDFTAILPMHKDEASGLTVLDDMTFELVLSNQWSKGAGNAYPVENHTGVVQIAPADPGTLYSNNSGQSGTTPIDATHGPISQFQPGYYCNVEKTGTQRYTYDYGGWGSYGNGHLIGAPMGDIYTFTVRHDFAMDTATTGSVTASYFRDTAQAVFASWFESQDLVAPYDAQYVGCNTPATSENLVLKFGGGKNGIQRFGYHAIRMYDRALDEAEMRQNHAADLFKYYGVDISLYTVLDGIEKSTVHTALKSVMLGTTSKEAIEEILLANDVFKYADLYVLEDLAFAWDAFDIAEDFNGQMVSWYDGKMITPGSTYAWTSMNMPDGVTSCKAFGVANKCFIGVGAMDFSALLPQHVDEESGLVVLDDMTFELVLSNQWPTAGMRNHVNYTGVIQVAPANAGMLHSYNDTSEAGWYPQDETYGPISLTCPGYYTPMDPTATGRNARFFDMGSWNSAPGNHFLGAPMGDVYSIGISHDFTMNTETTGELFVSYYRDARPAIDNSWKGSQSTLNARYDARYVGNFNEVIEGGWAGETLEANADTLKLTFGGGANGVMKFGYHAVRMYNRALNEAELRQNHMADLLKYYEVDFEYCEMLTASQIAYLATALKDVQLGETDKETLNEMVRKTALGLNEKFLETLGLMSFDGYQVRGYSQTALRALYTVDTAIELGEGSTLLEIGAIVGAVGDTELTVELTDNGYATPNERATVKTIWKDGAFTVDESELLVGEDGKTQFTQMVTFDGTDAIAADYKTELAFRAYAVIDMNGAPTVVYTDMTSERFGETVTMLEVAQQKEVRELPMAKEAVRLAMGAEKAPIFAADTLLNADGTINTECDDPLTIVYIGGSLTELGNSVWCKAVTEYLQTVFPNREIKAVNVGIGATGSGTGAERIAVQVAPYEPDIVFMEFTVNDNLSNFFRDNGQYYLESIMYQLARLPKIPALIYAHTPRAVDVGTGIHSAWLNQVEYKEEWAEYYGVSTINIYDYIRRVYDAAKAAQPTLSFTDFLAQQYKYDGSSDDEIFDVHGGYEWYKEAIIEAMEERLPEMLKAFTIHSDYLWDEHKDKIEVTFTAIPHDDDRVSYEGNWNVYTKENPYPQTSGQNAMSTHRYNFPFFDKGLHAVENASGAAFELKTTANKIRFYFMGTQIPSSATVYMNGVEVGKISCNAATMIQPLFHGVDLDNPNNEEVTVRVVVDEGSSYRFGYIYEGFCIN